MNARDQTCRFPGCRRPARGCELDHVHAWASGGTTDAANLIALCPRHHHAKHDAGWQVTTHPDGSLTWTSPTGRTYELPPTALPIDTTPAGGDDVDDHNHSDEPAADPYAPTPDAAWPPPGYDPYDDPENEIRPAPRPRRQTTTPPPALPDDPPF